MLAKNVEIFKKYSDEKLAEYKLGEDGVVQILIELDLVRVIFEKDGERKSKGYMGFSCIYEEESEVEIW